jgi:predicted nucleic acid-binding protein
MIGIDTSVIVRLLVGEPAGQAAAARRLVEARASGGMTVAVSDLAVGEAYFALRHHYRVPHVQAVRALRALLADVRVNPLGSAAEVLATPDAETPAPGFMDRLIHADYQRASADFATFDRQAARLPGAELIDAD